jgi:hypothetical protein
MRPLPLCWGIVLSLSLAVSADAQSPPEQLCGRDIQTIGDAWENVQVERYEFERILASGSLVLWPQRMAAQVSHLRFMERRAQLPQAQRDLIATGVQLVAGRSLPSNQFALADDVDGLRAELAQIEAGTTLVGQQFPADQLKPLVPLSHLLGPMPPQLRATLVDVSEAIAGKPVDVTFRLLKSGTDDMPAQVSRCHAYLISVDGGDFSLASAVATERPGEYRASFTAGHIGPHRLWIAAALDPNGREQLLRIDLTGEAESTPLKPLSELLTITRGTSRAELRFVGAGPRAGEIAVARLILSRSDGQPMTPLEPVLGGIAHLIAFTNGAQQAIPIRPTGPAAQPEVAGTVEIDFRFRPAAPGDCHLFAEIKTNGVNEMLCFTFPVKPSR